MLLQDSNNSIKYFRVNYVHILMLPRSILWPCTKLLVITSLTPAECGIYDYTRIGVSIQCRLGTYKQVIPRVLLSIYWNLPTILNLIKSIFHILPKNLYAFLTSIFFLLSRDHIKWNWISPQASSLLPSSQAMFPRPGTASVKTVHMTGSFLESIKPAPSLEAIGARRTATPSEPIVTIANGSRKEIHPTTITTAWCHGAASRQALMTKAPTLGRKCLVTLIRTYARRVFCTAAALTRTMTASWRARSGRI